MTDPKPVPYPADTRAKGWRFELDYEKIEQSDTWDLANEIPLAQQCLLMMWYVAWKQEPCGSLPADESTLRAKCRVPADLWPGLRDVLMRGWWLAEDGRLYHDTLVARVNEMLGYRRKTAERVAKHKAAQREQHEGNALPARGSPAKNDTGTGTGTGTIVSSQDEPVKKARAARSAPPPCPDDVAPQVWADWLALRAKHRADATQTVIDAGRSEADKAGLTFEAFLREWCLRGSRGLKAEWLRPEGRAAPGRAADNARIIDELTGGIMSHKPKESSRATGEIIDV